VVDPTPRHVLVLFENSSRGAAALREAAELADVPREVVSG